MSNSSNGRHGDHPDSGRRLRYDDLSSIIVRTSARTPVSDAHLVASVPWASRLPRSHSGRRFVIVAGLTVLLIWGVLFLAFRVWRERYRERAAYGAAQVVPAIDPMAGIVPPRVDPVAWHDVVRQSHDMLLTVTSSNLLGIDEMTALRTELEQTVSRARDRPETAVAELANVWDEMAERGEFFFKDSRSQSGTRHPWPRLLPTYGETRVVPALRPLSTFVPPGVAPADWRDALSRTAALLLAVTDSNRLDTTQMKALRSSLDQTVARAVADPTTAVDLLTGVWDGLADRYRSLSRSSRSDADRRMPRPKLLPTRP